jgi:DNA-binding NtrC family response regulator
MRALVATLERFAKSDLTLLVEGETGSGKEVVCEAIHASSSRSNGPYVVFDCSSVPPALLASELFGHERGAFTGADAARPGRFEEAEGGTLLLDELGELPLELQTYLLGAIERKSTRRVGGMRDHHHDVRILAATNRNLQEEVRAKRFREDLYHRLAAGRVRVPPLRERDEDIPVLAEDLAREVGLLLQPEHLVLLKSYEWPGNVRELRNTLLRLAALPDSAPELLSDLVQHRSARRDDHLARLMFLKEDELRPLQEARRLAADELERRYIEHVLAECKQSLTQAAALCGISRQAFTKLALRHGLHPRS